jgi:hypothetical protein
MADPAAIADNRQILALQLALQLLQQGLGPRLLLGIGAQRAGLEGDYYHRMTPQAMLRRFTHVQATLVKTRGQPAQIELELTPGQIEVLGALNLPDPKTYLHPTDHA